MIGPLPIRLVCQVFFKDLFGITEFFSLGCHVLRLLCSHLQTPALHDHHEPEGLQKTHLLLLDDHCVDHDPTIYLGTEPGFCDSSALDHFFCDAKPVLKITCSDTWFMEKMVIICSALILIMTLMFVVWSYVSIIQTILRFPSAQQWKKAFSICSSQAVYLSISRIQEKMKWKLI